MPLIRILVLAGIIWLLYRLIRRLLPGKPDSDDRPAGARMVKCEYCSTYVPAEDACEYDGIFYCCEDHYRNSRLEHSS